MYIHTYVSLKKRGHNVKEYRKIVVPQGRVMTFYTPRSLYTRPALDLNILDELGPLLFINVGMYVVVDTISSLV
jgi:hypothetical protein